MRDNFYNWKVSVLLDKDLGIDFGDLFREGKESISLVYCEGFQKDWVWKRYSKNKKKFTIEIRGTNNLYVFCWLIKQELKKKTEDTKETIGLLQSLKEVTVTLQDKLTKMNTREILTQKEKYEKLVEGIYIKLPVDGETEVLLDEALFLFNPDFIKNSFYGGSFNTITDLIKALKEVIEKGTVEL